MGKLIGTNKCISIKEIQTLKRPQISETFIVRMQESFNLLSMTLTNDGGAFLKISALSMRLLHCEEYNHLFMCTLVYLNMF